MTYNHLTNEQTKKLESQGCSAADWSQVMIAQGCDLSKIQNVIFSGVVKVGATNGVHNVDGVELPSGLYSASIASCEIGDGVRIANIGSAISNYVIDNNVLIQDVAALVADPGATFGNGVELETINEGGGRVVRILNDLTSQVAYVQGMYRHNEAFSKNLAALVQAKADEAKSDKGHICTDARIVHCGTIHNVNVGVKASVHGAQFLENGTINSCVEHPSEIGEGVQAKSFILSEGARVESGALLDKAFVGQAVKMGKQYSAENSLFFANCEAFHGEAVSLFGGPYTVTHHKSTLLIAGMFSFYNAGSGTNQSNHMYKLGPVHQGILERGSKTGSFSYLLLEAHIGAFSVVIGKHYSNLELPNLPFSYISEEDGNSKVVPGMNLVSVGTVRDGEKWPKRDGRKSTKKRDLIVFDVFSPYTVEKMRRGRDELLALSTSVPKEKAYVTYGGAQLSRLMLKKGARYYALAVTRYLLDKVMSRVQEALAKEKNLASALISLKPVSMLGQSAEWTDISGLLTPRERMAAFESRVASGVVRTYDALLGEFQAMYDAYRADEWQYVYETFAKEYGVQLDAATKDLLQKVADDWEAAATSLQSTIVEDSKKEFGAFARIGSGLDQSAENKQQDFESVRGTIQTNGVVQKLVAEGNAFQQRKEQFKNLISTSIV
ncbi:MAG TPA: DUF4954 family protein [Bacteroidota bacterium]|nr:DUF4954 family protein [Bacteroidota bacterium]